jgi:cytoskeleton protein RodZ
MQVDSDSLGGYLRVERERQRVSLQDIAATTKIQLKFLEALERDEYERLPPAPFVVGFLRAYAQYLALDVDAILTAYRVIYRLPEEPESAQPSVLHPTRRSKRLGTLGIGILVLVLGVTVSAVVREWGQHWSAGTRAASQPFLPAPQVAVPPLTPVHTEAPALEPEQAVQPASVPASPAPVVSTHASAPTFATSVAMSSALQNPTTPPGLAFVPPETNVALVLQAHAMEDTWLRVEIDGEKRRELLLASGKSASWEASERFALTIGNVRGTRVTLNGQEMTLPQPRSNVVRDLQLTRAQLN